MYAFGSNVLKIGFGASSRKNSSGVSNGTPTFAAKSLYAHVRISVYKEHVISM